MSHPEENILRKLLMVDDDEDDYLLVREMLTDVQQGKCSLEWARTYQAGMAALQTKHYDAVLMDYDLGLHNGLELIREATAIGYPGAFILFTGRGSREIDIEAMQAGASMYLTKGETSALMLERGIRYAIERKQSEEALRKSESRYRELVQLANSAIIRWSCDGAITFFNEYAEAFFGWSADEVNGKPVSILIPKQDSAGADLTRLAQDIVDHPERFEYYENENVCRDGRRVWMSWTNRPILDNQGHVAEILAIGSDITERRAAEEALTRSNLKITEILSSITDDFYVLDRDWKFVYANQQFTRKVGKEPEDFIGNCIWELFPKHIGTILYENFHASMDRGEIRRFEVGGQYTKAWYSMVSFPSAEGITVLGLDITDRKRAEAALSETEQRFRSILESSRDIIYRINLKTDRFDYISSTCEQIVGYTAEELIAQDSITSLNMVHPDDREAFRKALVQLETVDTTEVEYRQKTKQGDYRWMSNRLYILRDESGRQIYRNGSIRDITEQKRSEEALRKLEARWNAAIESFAEGAIIATSDEQVIYWNPAARQMHGIKGPDENIEPLEKTPITFQLWTPDGSHMLDLDEWPMRRIKRGETVRNLQLLIRRPDQGWEKFFSYSGAMLDTAGGERLIFLTCRDLTEQRRIEQALRESEARLRNSTNPP